MWQCDDFAQLLVGVTRVGVGCDVDLYALVELGCGGFAGAFDGVGSVEKVSRDGCVDLAVALAVFLCGHVGKVLFVMIVLRCLVDDEYAHASGGAFDDVHGGVDVVGVQLFYFGLGDLLELVAGDGTGDCSTGGFGTGFDACGLFDERRCGRRFDDEGEGSVGVDVDGGTDDHAALGR